MGEVSMTYAVVLGLMKYVTQNQLMLITLLKDRGFTDESIEKIQEIGNNVYHDNLRAAKRVAAELRIQSGDRG